MRSTLDIYWNFLGGLIVNTAATLAEVDISAGSLHEYCRTFDDAGESIRDLVSDYDTKIADVAAVLTTDNFESDELLCMCKDNAYARYVFWLFALARAEEQRKVLVLSGAGARLLRQSLMNGESVALLREILNTYSITQDILSVFRSTMPAGVAMTYSYMVLKATKLSALAVEYVGPLCTLTAEQHPPAIAFDGYAGSYSNRNGFSDEKKLILLQYYLDTVIPVNALPKEELSDMTVCDYIEGLAITNTFFNHLYVYGDRSATVFRLHANAHIICVYDGEYKGLYLRSNVSGKARVYKLHSLLWNVDCIHSTSTVSPCEEKDVYPTVRLKVALDTYEKRYNIQWNTEEIARLISLCVPNSNKVADIIESI